MTRTSSSTVAALPSPPIAERREPSAFRSIAAHARLWLAAVIGLAVDLWAKEWAFSSLAWDEPRKLIDNVLTLRLSLNPGALFGMGAGWAPVFIGASVLALMFVLYLFIHSTPKHRSLHVALGLVLAGALGNLYDRTTHQAFIVQDARSPARHYGQLVSQDQASVILRDFGSQPAPRFYSKNDVIALGARPVVRDFIQFEFRAFGHTLWPWIFNIADALLVVGVAVLLLNFALDARREREAAY